MSTPECNTTFGGTLGYSGMLPLGVLPLPRLLRKLAPRATMYSCVTAWTVGKQLKLFVAAGRATAMGQRARVVQSFEPDAGSIFEIEVAQGDEVELTDSDAPPGWVSVRIDDIEGLVPADFVEPIVEPSTPGSEAGDSGSEGGLKVDTGDTNYDDFDPDEANRRQALHDFEVEPGVIYELPLKKGEIVEILDEEAPEGWITVKKMDDPDAVGLVPEIYLGAAPRLNPNAPTEEQMALRKAQDQKAEVEAELQRAREERAAFEEQTEAAAAAAAAREDELKAQLRNMEALEEHRLEAARLRIEGTLIRQGELEDKRTVMDFEESVWPSNDQIALKAAVEAADKARLEAKEEFERVEQEWTKAERKLREAERLKAEAEANLRKQEESRDANARALKLLPAMQQLMAPTQKELQLCVETVTKAVIQNAEESARLLAKLSLTREVDPADALKQAVQQRNEGLAKIGVGLGDATYRNSGTATAGRSSRPGSARPGGAIVRPADPNEAMYVDISKLPPANQTPANSVSVAAYQGMTDPAPPPSEKFRRPRPPAGEPTRPTSAPLRGGGRRANKTLMLRDADRSFATSPRHASNENRNPMGKRGSSVPGVGKTRRDPYPERVRKEVGMSGDVGVSGMNGTKALDDDVADAGEAHTRDPSYHAAAPSAASPSGSKKTSKTASPTASPPGAHAGDRAPRVLGDVDRSLSAAENIARIAPHASHSAKMIERQHHALRAELSNTRDSIKERKLGRIEYGDPSQDQRIQHRTAHATYYHMMRQRKARENEMRQRAVWEAQLSGR